MENVLAISAHIDDVEFGCGGTLLKHRDAGDHINIVVLEWQDKLGGDVEARQIEQNQAGKLLNAVVTGLNSELQHDKNVIEILDRMNPSVIYLPYKDDYHQDHRHAHTIGMAVARRFEADIFAYFSVTSYNYWPNALKLIDFDEKMKLVNIFKSQIERRPEYLEILKAQNSFFSSLLPQRLKGMSAEGFCVHRVIL